MPIAVRVAGNKVLYILIVSLILLSTGYIAYAGNAGPEIYGLTPVPGSEIQYAEFTIAAQISDPEGINPAATFFELDGEARIGVIIRLNSPTEATIEYVVSGLKPGEHQVKLLVQDNVGNSSSRSWNFTVPEGNLIPTEPQKPRPGDTNDNLPEGDTGNPEDGGEGDNSRLEVEQPKVIYLFPQGKINVLKPIVSAVVSNVYGTTPVEAKVEIVQKGSQNKISFEPDNWTRIDEKTVVTSFALPEDKNLLANEEYNLFFYFNDSVTPWSFSTADKKGTIEGNGTPREISLLSIGPYLPAQLDKARGFLDLYLGKLSHSTDEVTKRADVVHSFRSVEEDKDNLYNSVFSFKTQDFIDGLHKLGIQIEAQPGVYVTIFEDEYIIRDPNTSCNECHHSKPYDHRTFEGSRRQNGETDDLCRACHTIINNSLRSSGNPENGCAGCHSSGEDDYDWDSKWPHGPEVFINPKLSSTPTLCQDCHLNSDLRSEAKPESDPVYGPMNNYNHRIIDKTLLNQR